MARRADPESPYRVSIHKNNGYRYARVLYLNDSYTTTVTVPDQVAFKGGWS